MNIKILEEIISHVLQALYQPFWFALLLSIFFMFIWKSYNSIKEACLQWIRWFKNDKQFRKVFVLCFCTVMILFRTLLNRNMWTNPVSNVIGIWGLYKESNGELVFTTEAPENLLLFFPFIICLFWCFKDKILGEVRFIKILWKSAEISFLFSLSIEMLQLFLRLGTWQLSDLFYNTLGGIMGGCCYWLIYRIKH